MSQSLKIGNFEIRQRKFKNNTVVYLQNFLLYYAKFPFLNHIEFESRLPTHGDALCYTLRGYGFS